MPSTSPGLTAQIGLGRGADRPHGVNQAFGTVGVAADRDRHLAGAERVHHVELTRIELEWSPSVERLERECPRVLGLPNLVDYPKAVGQHRRRLGSGAFSAAEAIDIEQPEAGRLESLHITAANRRISS